MSEGEPRTLLDHDLKSGQVSVTIQDGEIWLEVWVHSERADTTLSKQDVLNPATDQLRQGLKLFSVYLAKGAREESRVSLTSDMTAVKEGWRKYHPGDRGSCTCWARDEQHAIKIANERWAQAIWEWLG